MSKRHDETSVITETSADDNDKLALILSDEEGDVGRFCSTDLFSNKSPLRKLSMTHTETGRDYMCK